MSIPILSKVISDNKETSIVYLTEGSTVLNGDYTNAVCLSRISDCEHKPVYKITLSDSTIMYIGENTPLAVWKDGVTEFITIAQHGQDLTGLRIPFTNPEIPKNYTVSKREIPPDVLAEYLMLPKFKVYDSNKFWLYAPKAYKKFIKFLLPDHAEYIDVDDRKDVAFTSNRLEHFINRKLISTTKRFVPTEYIYGELAYADQLIQELFGNDQSKGISLNCSIPVYQLAIMAASVGYALVYTESNGKYFATVSNTVHRTIVKCTPYHSSSMVNVTTNDGSPFFLHNYTLTH